MEQLSHYKINYINAVANYCAFYIIYCCSYGDPTPSGALLGCIQAKNSVINVINKNKVKIGSNNMSKTDKKLVLSIINEKIEKIINKNNSEEKWQRFSIKRLSKNSYKTRILELYESFDNHPISVCPEPIKWNWRCK